MATSINSNYTIIGDCSPESSNTFEKKIPEHLKEEFVKTEASMKKERSEWLEKKVLYTALQSVLEDVRLKMCEGDPNRFNEIQEKVLQAEIDYCGLKTCVAKQNQSSRIQKEHEKTLATLVEKKLMQTCKEVLEYHDGVYSVEHTKPELQSARAIKLGEIIKAKTKRLEMCHREYIDAQNTEKQTYATCIKQLLESSEYVSKILKIYLVELQPRRDDEKFSNIVSRCEALGLKAFSMTLKLQKELYTSDSIVALQSIRAELLKNKRNKHQETVAIEQQLQDYKDISDDFNAIVVEYNQLQIDIEKRKWALDKLQQ